MQDLQKKAKSVYQKPIVFYTLAMDIPKMKLIKQFLQKHPQDTLKKVQSCTLQSYKY